MIIRGTQISISSGTVEYRAAYGNQCQVVRVFGKGDHVRIMSFFEKWDPDLKVLPASQSLKEILEYIKDAEARLSNASTSFPSA